MKRIARSRFVQTLLIWLITGYIRLVRITSRFAEDGPGLDRFLDHWEGTRKPMVVCFWHGRLMMMARFRRRDQRHSNVLISTHADGELIARAIENLGMTTVRGSSRRGGVGALRELLQVIERGEIAVFTPDGPKGPRMRAQGGAIAAASATGVPLFPVTVSTRRGPILNSWDRFLLATPFNRGLYFVGEPIMVPPDLDDDAFERWRLLLETRLNDLTAEADRRMGRATVEPAPPGRLRR
ncbi:lysophospholipid acyltransferase family protein [Zavarzinia compransoris]|uniref:lysophospholipid acyltransferase family protein n=1 Tax=Zavarzinia marina TaxID=2911065 RepID=UPI001F47BE04|nr:lysophospholipid acyltransferase family protein [Zavarzinia marina]MCF4164158.1 lysophospholipid acyltransferase family protein [Zavarzinia marina]